LQPDESGEDMTLEPVTNRYKISYPEKESEFEVQAFLFSSLKALGLDVRGEVQCHGAFGMRSKKASCRFDLVLFEDKEAVLVLEVKARPVKHKTSVEDTRQGRRYPHFGVPVRFIYGMEDAKEFLSTYTL
jgi:hypothetical protein